MVRAEPFKKWRVRTEITERLEAKKKKMNRHDSLTAFIEWVLDMYAKDQLEDALVLRARIEAELRPDVEARVRAAIMGEPAVATAAKAERQRKMNERQKAS